MPGIPGVFTSWHSGLCCAPGSVFITCWPFHGVNPRLAPLAGADRGSSVILQLSVTSCSCGLGRGDDLVLSRGHQEVTLVPAAGDEQEDRAETSHAAEAEESQRDDVGE